MEILAKSQTSADSLSICGSITLLAGALVLAMLTNGAFLLIPLTYAVAACLFFSPEAFRDLRQIVMLVPAVILLSTLLWQNEYIDTTPLQGATFSPYVAGFMVGVEMSLRAVVIVLAVSVFVRRTKFSELSSLMESVTKSRSFSFVFGLAFNIKPYLERISKDTLNAIKMRGGFRPKNIAPSVRYLLSSTTLNALAKCQDLSYAAEARAFGSTRSATCLESGERIRVSRTDLLILVATAIVVALSLASRA